MALVLADRVRETTAVVGTGTATLLGAVAGYQSFTAVGNANTTYYVIASQAAGEWEVGIGTYTASGTTLSRDTVLSSSNAGALVNFSAGTKDIWVDYAAGKAVTTDTLAYPPAIGSTTPAAGTFTTLTATGQTSLGGLSTSKTLQVDASAGGTTQYLLIARDSGANTQRISAVGANLGIEATGGGALNFRTATASETQMAVTRTASAVNYVQVTGAATGGSSVISAQGSDTNTGLQLRSKGTGDINLMTAGGTNQVVISNVASAVNYLSLRGSAAGGAVPIQVFGSDTNISQVFQSKGTGAIDLAAGSSGVNISNGGTVTALTRIGAGSGYTSVPTVAISAPTTAGGVQATVTTPISINVASISNGGTGYTLNDVITVVGGTFATTASKFTVSAVSGGVVTGLTASVADNYTVFPTQPANTTGGTGTGLTLTSLSGFVPSGSFVITNAGSGYVEQPTVTFSGGGGSGAAAYATVGSGTVVRSLGATFDFFNPAGRSFQVLNSPNPNPVNFIQASPNSTGQPAYLAVGSSDTNASIWFFSKGTGSIDSWTGGGRQLLVSNTPSAVNYVQVTGAATGGAPTIFAQGSDTNIPLVLQPKGTGALQAQQTDSTATGGNARGAYAVDWQTSRNNAAMVASGTNATIGGGNLNRASSTYTVVAGGNNNTASGFGAAIAGGNTNTSSSAYSFVGAGEANVASNYSSAVVAGSNNTAAGYSNFIGGGAANSGTSGFSVTTQSATMNGTTAVTLSGSNANIRVGQFITGTSIADQTYVAAISGTSLTLSKVASGSSTSTLSFFTPHGVVVGGGNNQATGSYSFIGGGGDAGTAANRNVASGDWSTVAGGIKNTASGLGSFIGGGGSDGTSILGNTASGTLSFIGGGFVNTASSQGTVIGGGAANTANSLYGSIAGGVRGTTRAIQGNQAVAPCVVPIADVSGVSQLSLLVLARQTTDATATVLTSNTSAASTTNQVIMPNNSAYFFRGEVVAGVTGGGNTKGWTIEGVIKRGANAASTALVGTPMVTSAYADVGAATWAIAVTADTTNGGLAVTFTGQAGTTIRTVAKIETTEMTF